MNICIRVIPHDTHRYETVGDYWYSGFSKGVETDMEVRVSDMQNEDYEFLVGIHEQIEAHLCRRRGIPVAAIDTFDIAFETARAEGNLDEPGDSPNAPYRKEHQFATSIERQIAAELGVDWDTYNETVNKL